MTILLTVWLGLGFFHWVHWMIINPFPNLLDFIIVLPAALALGPTITIQKLFNIL